ncbi:MAG: beta-lactamase [Caulobacteraceae bacterium]|nr:beta-lactamase [Caulobacteraceae bacterium]
MSPRAPRTLLLLAVAALAAAACDKLPGRGAKLGFDKERLEAALDPSVGGPDTCMVIEDVKTGAEVYRYGAQSVCNRPLAPCATFQIPLALIGLSDAKLRPDETWTWDGKVQPYKAWEHDTDLKGAWRSGSGWFFRRLALAIGPDRFKQQLSAFGYGQGGPVGRPESFWQGPAAGGGLFLSTRNQADVLRKLARSELPVKPEAAAAVQGLMADTVRGGVALSSLGGSCPSIADDSHSVSWWLGRLQGPDSDRVFALSIESQNPLPGSEIRSRILPIFTNVGLLPAA